MADTSLSMASPQGAPVRGEPADRFALSKQQDFLRMVDHGDESGPFGPRYTIVGGWRVRGELDLGTLQTALDDVVVRHEALRTSLVIQGEDSFQQMHPPAQVRVTVRELAAGPGDRDAVAEDFLNDVEAGVFGMHEMPLVEAWVGRFDRSDAVLVLMAHHTAVDGWSVHRVVYDLAICYAARRAGRQADLAPARQYREYVAWQQATASGPAVRGARTYWRENLRGARMWANRTDLPRREGDFVTGWYRFVLPDRYRTAVLERASRTHSSPFMVLMAAYLTYLRQLGGENELVVPTFTPGRNPSWVEDTVGSFYNFLPLRTDLTGCDRFEDVVARLRATCFDAYRHEMPFAYLIEEAPDLMDDAIADRGAAGVFQVTQSPRMMMLGERYGDLHYTAMRRRWRSAQVGSQLPDGLLWGLELHPGGGINGSVGYTRNLFGERSVAAMVSDYLTVVDALILSGD
jgi:condensation enzyme